MRIAFLPGGLYEDPTYSRVLSNLQGELTLLGHDCCILRGANGVSSIGLRPPPAADFADIPLLPSGYFSLPRLFRLAFALIRISKSRRLGIIHLHFSGCFRPWFAALLLAREISCFRLIVTFQDYRHPDFPEPSWHEMILLKVLLMRAHAITCVSEFLKALIEKDFPFVKGKIITILNGAAAPSYPPPEVSPPFSPGSYILSAGRLAPYKGMDLLVMAFHNAVERGLLSRLVIAGADFQGGQLRGLIAKLGLSGKVTLAGPQDFSGISMLMRNCLFFSLLSRRESFGMAVLEAMSHGKAVLASNAGGIPEFLTHEKNGLLVDPFKIENAADALLRLENDAPLRERLGGCAASAAAGLRWEHIARSYADNAYP